MIGTITINSDGDVFYQNGDECVTLKGEELISLLVEYHVRATINEERVPPIDLYKFRKY